MGVWDSEESIKSVVKLLKRHFKFGFDSDISSVNVDLFLVGGLIPSYIKSRSIFVEIGVLCVNHLHLFTITVEIYQKYIIMFSIAHC